MGKYEREENHNGHVRNRSVVMRDCILCVVYSHALPVIMRLVLNNSKIIPAHGV